jgi:phage regulator Rha-like protein
MDTLNSLAELKTAKKMSSREMASLTEKRHDNVKRTIDSLVAKGVIASPQIEETSFDGSDGRRQTTTEYLVGERDSYVIVAQLSPEFTARVVDRWQELEQRVQQPTTTLMQDKAQTIMLVSSSLHTMFGVPRGLAAAHGLMLVQKETGINTEVLRLTLAKDPDELDFTLNATRVGELLGCSAKAANLRLAKAGLQLSDPRERWVLTQEGKKWGAAFPFSAETGRTGFQVLWSSRVAELLKEAA